MTVVTFAEDATASAAGVDPATDPAPKMRVMLPGSCALCACTSARRWYNLDEPMPTSDPTDDPGGDVTYVAGKGTSRERRLPLTLGKRAQWRGAGSGAALNEAQLCPYCHVQNEQLWQESVGAGVRTPADVRSTLSRFDRVMSILAPQNRAKPGAGARPRRRKNGASGRRYLGDEVGDEDVGATTRLSTSAPSSTDEGGALLLRHAMNGLGVGQGRRSALEEAELKEELAVDRCFYEFPGVHSQR